MADKTIGALTQATQLDDNSLLVVEQGGQACSITGKLVADFAKDAVAADVQSVANNAAAAQAAQKAAEAARDDAQAISGGDFASIPYVDNAIENHTHDITVSISGVLGIENGGTGATTAEEARQNLGITGAGGSSATVVPITLSASGWSGTPLKQTVSVPGILADETKQMIWPAPSLASQSVWIAASVMVTELGSNSVVFTASEEPTADISGYVSFMGV